MRRRFLAQLTAAFAVLAILSPAFGAATVFPPGLRIGLEPPGDLRLSTRFPGFEDADRKVAVTIFDLPAAAYPSLEQSTAVTKQPGLSDVKREDLSFRGGAGSLFTAKVRTDGTTLNKWILLARDADKDLAMLISVEVPDAALEVYSDAVIRKALATVSFRPSPIQEQLAMLPYKLDQLAGFRVMRVLPQGDIVLTDGAADDLAKQPYMIVSLGRGAPDQADDRARFARDLLTTTPLPDLRMQSGESMRITGQPGYEIRAEAKSPDGGTLSLVQWTRFGGGDGFMRIIGIGPKADWDKLFTRFRALRDGLAFR
jgi:hypothetical protein